MNWFMSKLAKDDSEANIGRNIETNTESIAKAPQPERVDFLTGLEEFYDSSKNVAPDVVGQLANIVGNLCQNKMSEDKLIEKIYVLCKTGKLQGVRFDQSQPGNPGKIIANHAVKRYKVATCAKMLPCKRWSPLCRPPKSRNGIEMRQSFHKNKDGGNHYSSRRWTGIQTWVRFHFNDSYSDSDSSRPFRFRFQLRFRSYRLLLIILTVIYCLTLVQHNHVTIKVWMLPVTSACFSDTLFCQV